MRDTSERYVNDFAEKTTTCVNCHGTIEKGMAVVHDNVTGQEIHQGLCSPVSGLQDMSYESRKARTDSHEVLLAELEGKYAMIGPNEQGNPAMDYEIAFEVANEWTKSARIMEVTATSKEQAKMQARKEIAEKYKGCTIMFCEVLREEKTVE